MAPHGPKTVQRDREAIPISTTRQTPPRQNLLRRLPNPLRVGLLPTLSRQLSGVHEDQQQQEHQSQKQRTPWRSQQLGWHTAAVGMVGFTAVTADVFADSSAHLLAEVDAWGHATAQSLDPTLRSLVLEVTVSDSFIFAGMLGWAAMTLYVALNPKPEATAPAAALGLAWLTYGVTGGRIDGSTMVGFMKEFFNRARPSPIHRSMSFPSGHTTTAVLLVGSLLFVLVPVLLHKMETNPNSRIHQWLKQLEASWPLFCTTWATTAVARILGDAHWTSDTLAGGFLSLTVVSVLAKATEYVLEAMDPPEGGEKEAVAVPATAEPTVVLVRTSEDRGDAERYRREQERMD